MDRLSNRFKSNLTVTDDAVYLGPIEETLKKARAGHQPRSLLETINKSINRPLLDAFEQSQSPDAHIILFDRFQTVTQRIIEKRLPAELINKLFINLITSIPVTDVSISQKKLAFCNQLLNYLTDQKTPENEPAIRTIKIALLNAMATSAASFSREGSILTQGALVIHNVCDYAEQNKLPISLAGADNNAVYQAFLRAISKKDYDRCVFLVENKANLNEAVFFKGVWHWAIKETNLDFISYLMSRKIQIQDWKPVFDALDTILQKKEQNHDGEKILLRLARYQNFSAKKYRDEAKNTISYIISKTEIPDYKLEDTIEGSVHLTPTINATQDALNQFPMTSLGLGASPHKRRFNQQSGDNSLPLDPN